MRLEEEFAFYKHSVIDLTNDNNESTCFFCGHGAVGYTGVVLMGTKREYSPRPLPLTTLAVAPPPKKKSRVSLRPQSGFDCFVNMCSLYCRRSCGA